jgi:hypothetical protein
MVVAVLFARSNPRKRSRYQRISHRLRESVDVSVDRDADTIVRPVAYRCDTNRRHRHYHNHATISNGYYT